MVKVGEIVSGKLLKNDKWRRHYIWSRCPDCGKERWIRTKKDDRSLSNKLCLKCSHKWNENITHHWNWKGGRNIDARGYVRIWVSKNDFFSPMRTKTGYVAEHRLVMAKYIGRNLQKWEHIHHKNGNKHGNRIENLEIVDSRNHTIDHHKGYLDGFNKGYVDGKTKKICELEIENRMLKNELALARKLGKEVIFED